MRKIYPEELPRRFSNQFSQGIRKHLENFICKINLSDQKTVSIGGKREFFLNIFFKLLNRKHPQFQPGFRVSIPFGFKPAPMGFIGFRKSRNFFRKKNPSNQGKSKIFFKDTRKKGHFLGFPFLKKFLYFFLRNFSFECFSPFVLEYGTTFQQRNNWGGAGKFGVFRLFKHLNQLYFYKITNFSFRIEYKRPDCLKQMVNNIFQVLGSVHDRTGEINLGIQEMLLKSKNSLQISFPF